MNKHADKPEQARQQAFFLLKYRPRSEQEIIQRLKKKRFESPVIRETLDFLKKKRFIDDTEFARLWVESRLAKPLGIRAVRRELVLKGISDEIIHSVITDALKNYCESDIVNRLALQYLTKTSGADRASALKKVYARLIRRGFSPDTVSQALEEFNNRD